MPLNPNGKIDKPALPFPDTVQAAAVERGVSASATKKGTSTEETMRSIWATILPNAPSPIPLDESFFDLGGHSILATRLIFEIRKAFVVNAPLGLVFDQPTISGLVTAVDALRNTDFAIAFKDSTPPSPSTTHFAVPGIRDVNKPPSMAEYGNDYTNLLKKLRPSYPSLPADFTKQPLTIFLTGATGFLGVFVLRDLLQRQNRVQRVICLVRASDSQKALDRLREGATDRGCWDEDWIKSERLEIVTGDLGLDLFGLNKDSWTRIASEADAIVHNGALVRCTISFGVQIIVAHRLYAFRSTGFIHMRN
jgi:L-2-aminoadipate reductase